MSLCFDEAWTTLQRKEITDDQYVAHIVSHFRGIRHPPDTNATARRWEGSITNSVRALALSHSYHPLSDTTLYQSLFSDCFAGNLDQIKTSLAQVEDNPQLPNPIQSLAVISAFRGHVESLKFLVERGARFDEWLDMALETAYRSHEGVHMLEYLFAINWKNMRHSQDTMNRMFLDMMSFSEVPLKWLLDHGGRVNTETMIEVARDRSQFPVLVLVSENYGIDKLKDTLRGTGSLQMAAMLGDLPRVKYFLDAGVDINEMPPLIDIREAFPYTALYEAVRRQHVDVVRLLVQRGAQTDTYIPLFRETAVQKAIFLGNSEILDILGIDLSEHKI